MTSSRPRVSPALRVFLAFFAGVLFAGLAGSPLAVLGLAGLAALAWALTRLRGLRPPGFVAPLALVFLLGSIRAGMQDADPPPIPHDSIAGTEDTIQVVCRVVRVMQRDAKGTQADVEVLAMARAGPARDLENPFRATLRSSGLLDLTAGSTFAARVRLRPPRPSGGALGPSWPRGRSNWSLGLSRPADIRILSGPGISQPHAVDRLRSLVATRINGSFSGDARDLLLAVLLGEGRGVDPGLRAHLATLGTAHVLAVSGLHVAAAAWIVGAILMRLIGPVAILIHPGVSLAGPRRWVGALAACGVALLANGTPSASRAAGMFVVACIAVFAGRRQPLDATVSLVGIGALCLDPVIATSASFLLSYGAVLGIAMLTRPIEESLCRIVGIPPDPATDHLHHRRGRLVLAAAAVSTAATLGTTPTALLLFGTVSPVAPLVNLIVLPATTFLIMPCALLVLGSAVLLPGLLEWTAPAIGFAFGAFLDAQVAAANLLPAPGWVAATGASAAVLALICALVASLLAPGRRAVAIGVFAGLVTGIIAAPPESDPGAGRVRVVFLDVGKGDSILVRCGRSGDWLLDAGEARVARGPSGLLARLRKHGVARLAGVVLTHADEDHVGGLPAVLSTMPVGEVLFPCPSADEAPLAGILDEVRKRGIPTRCLLSGMDALPGCGRSSKIIWPPPFRAVRRNAASLAFRLEAGEDSILLTGDLGFREEEELLDAGVDLRATWLKLGHHGSSSSSSEEFLDAVGPRGVVVSGHPTRKSREIPEPVLERLRGRGARLLRTVIDGDVSVDLGGGFPQF
jgi:competence protein ComEC